MNHEQQLERLVQCTDPLLIGVRHHSAALARSIPQLLTEFQPQVVLVELPHEFQSWLPWLGHEETEAPIALAASSKVGEELCFYPFADFSPELAAIRWAIEQEIQVVAADLPLAERPLAESRQHADCRDLLLRRLYLQFQCEDVGTLWERMVETPSYSSDAEAIRRAGLLFGAALRINDEQASQHDLQREQTMRACLAEHSGKRRAIVIGSYHAPALLSEPWLWNPPEDAETVDSTDECTTALIPYGFAQFDERSGYPAGIRDPLWQQKSFEAANATQLEHAIADFAVGVCRELRVAGHPINAADGKEVVRMAHDLANLRKLTVAGRGELIEAIQTCLTQGELMGIGRAVASATERVLIGQREGRLADETPRSGLGPHVDEIFSQLNLPREEKRMRLDPLRSRLDRARTVIFERLSLCGIPYASRIDTEGDALRENLTELWDVQWQHATAAVIELSSIRGATLAQAAQAILNNRSREDDMATGEQLNLLVVAAKCGSDQLVTSGLRELLGPFLHSASLAQLTQAMELIQRIRAGHIAGLPNRSDDAWQPYVTTFELPNDVDLMPLLQSALGQVAGLFGSQDVEDVRALLDLVLWFQQQDDEQHSLEAGRLLWLLRDMAKSGSPLMQGAGLAARLLLNDQPAHSVAESIGSWLDAAVDQTTRKSLRERLHGVLVMSRAKILIDVTLFAPLQQRMASLGDQSFLARLPSLRGGFEVVDPNVREQLLRSLLQQLPDEGDHLSSEEDPATIQMRLESDQEGRQRLAEFMPNLELRDETSFADAEPAVVAIDEPGRQLSLADRWRLTLGSGRKTCQSPLGRTAARALDELYGSLEGGASGELVPGFGGPGGKDEPYPNIREWSGDLEEMFGTDVREEVLTESLTDGRVAALDELDSLAVRPSIDLLQQMLSLKGAIPPSYLEKLRKMTKRIVEQLVKELAQRIQPALTGLALQRPTRRRTRRLDLQRTIRANMHTAQRQSNGQIQLIPDRLFFRQLARRSMDWHLTFVTDVSGSMEPSVIYTAMMAAIFSGLPAVSVDFLAFSTQVIDFSDHVNDPLELLLEVEVGGGTNIAKGLRYARQKIKNPSRTMIIVVTDFEEGFPIPPLLAEVRALVATGARPIGLAALSDDGQPRYNQGIAAQVVAAGMPVAALSPTQLAQWVGDQMR